MSFSNIDVYAYADATRGVAILLVVFGHVPGRLETSSEILDWFVTAIYLFHVPLLFFVSGLTAGFSTYEKHQEFGVAWVIKRFKRLMIPYFVMNLFYFSLQIFFSSFIVFNRPIDYNLLVKMLTDPSLGPMGPLWFLYVLFEMSIVFSILNALLRDGIGRYPSLFFMLSLALNLFPWPDIFAISMVFRYLPFFVAGAICFKHPLVQRIDSLDCFFVSLMIFLFFALSGDLPSQSLALSILAGFAGCVTALYAIRVIIANRRSSFFIWIGKYAMGIYVFHMLIITIWYHLTRAIYSSGLSVTGMSFMFVFAVMLPVALVKYIVLQSRPLTQMLLGAPVRE